MGKSTALRTAFVHHPQSAVCTHREELSSDPWYRRHQRRFAGGDGFNRGWIGRRTLPNVGRERPLHRSDPFGIASGGNPDAPIGQVIGNAPALASRSGNRPQLSAAGGVIHVDEELVIFRQTQWAADYTGVPNTFPDPAVSRRYRI